MKDLIDALGVLANPNATDEEKAAALAKLSAHFNAQLDAQEAQVAEAASTTPESVATTVEAASEASSDEDDKTKEMASSLASAHEQIKDLTDRLAKMEKASALGNAPRASKPTVIPRKEAPAPKDHVVSMIEAAERNTVRNLSK